MPAPRKMIPKEDINELIEQRYNNREISEILNISKSTLKKLLVEYNLKTKPKEDKNIGKSFGKLTVIELDEETSKKKKQIYWKCQCDCGNIKIALGETLRKNQVNSCGCLVSKGEERLIKILKENNYIFSTQYCFNDLRGEQLPLRFDFVIFDSNQNIECLIEYQGKQHYEQSEYFGGEDSFIKQRKYDALKKEYCKIHNIKLIEIPYWDFDKINAEYLQQKIFNGGERSALKRHC